MSGKKYSIIEINKAITMTESVIKEELQKLETYQAKLDIIKKTDFYKYSGTETRQEAESLETQMKIASDLLNFKIKTLKQLRN